LAWGSGLNLLGTLDLVDSFSGQNRKLDVMATEAGGAKTYSTGDAISGKGEILQLRVGEHVLRVTGGALWTVPLKDQAASGQASVEQSGAGYSAPGTFQWTATPVGQGKVRVEATVWYFSPSPSMQSGSVSTANGRRPTAPAANWRTLPPRSSEASFRFSPIW
jgi:hypothetical protein